MRRLILVPLLVVIGVVAILGGIGYWIYNNYTYYSTDDAQVNGQIVNISSPLNGQLTNLAVQIGDKVTAGQAVGTVTGVSTTTGAKTDVQVTSPIAGTIVQVSAVQGQGVSAGLSLVQIADLNHLDVIAYIDESAISNVKTNQTVDIKVDAYSGTNYTGHVDRIVQATADSFSLLPTTDPGSANFTKVGQRIPVLVSLDGGNASNDLVPGMSASVVIHLH